MDPRDTAARELHTEATSFTPSALEALRSEIARLREKVAAERAARNDSQQRATAPVPPLALIADAGSPAQDHGTGQPPEALMELMNRLRGAFRIAPDSGPTEAPHSDTEVPAPVTDRDRTEQRSEVLAGQDTPVAPSFAEEVLVDDRPAAETFGTATTVHELGQAVAVLGRQMQDVRQAPMALATALAAIRTDIDHLRASDKTDALAEAVAVLGRKIDLLNAKAPDPVALARLETHTATLKSVVAQALAHQDAMAARVAAEPVDVQPQMGVLQERLEHLSDQIAALSEERASQQSAALADQVQVLLQKIDQGKIDQGTGVAPDALAPLVDVIEHHLVVLTERMVDSHQHLDRLGGIETKLDRITGQMDTLSRASADASAEAMQAVALRLSARDDAPALIGLKRGLAALEARQREFEARTEEVLMRGIELELQDLVEMELVRPHRPDAGWHVGPAPAASGDAAHRAAHRADPRPDRDRAGFDPQSASNAARTPRGLDLDRRVLDVALGDERMFADVLVADTSRRFDWVAAAERAQERETAGRSGRAARKGGRGARSDAHGHMDSHGLSASARALGARVGRAAVVATALSLAGLTALQVTSSDASAPATIALAKSPAAGKTPLPVAAMDVSTLPPPVGSTALRNAALAGDPAAAYEVGVRYAEGKGTDVSQTAAVKWLGFAASKGSVPAAFRLGSLQEYGLKDLEAARKLYAYAAEQGNVRAMHNFGVLASEGVGGKPDWALATQWFTRAAELGLRDSQHNLGVIYARGLGGTTNLADAWKWFALAAGQGDTDSARKRDEVAARADAETLNKAKAAAATFVPSAPQGAANIVAVKAEWDALDGTEATPRKAASVVKAAP